MRLARTDADKLYDEIYSLVAYTIAITELPESQDISPTVKAKAIMNLTDSTFCSILRKIGKQRDRACAISSN